MSALRWTRRALQDLVAIGEFIGADKPVAARDWISRLRKSARTAAKMPRVGRRVPEVDMDDVREVVMRGYRIVYRIERNGVLVLTVFEGHRQLSRDLGLS